MDALEWFEYEPNRFRLRGEFEYEYKEYVDGYKFGQFNRFEIKTLKFDSEFIYNNPETVSEYFEIKTFTYCFDQLDYLTIEITDIVYKWTETSISRYHIFEESTDDYAHRILSVSDLIDSRIKLRKSRLYDFNNTEVSVLEYLAVNFKLYVYSSYVIYYQVKIKDLLNNEHSFAYRNVLERLGIWNFRKNDMTNIQALILKKTKKNRYATS